MTEPSIETANATTSELRLASVLRWPFAALVTAALVLFVAALPSRYRALLEIARENAAAYASTHGGDRGFVPPARGYAVVALALEALFVVSLVLVSTMIAWRQTRNWPAPLFATVFIAYAVWVTPTADTLPLRGGWGVLDAVVQGAGLFLAVLFFLLFPDGRFVPRWTRWWAALWAVIAIALAFDPDAYLSLIDPFDASVPAFLMLMLGGWGVGLVAQSARYRSYADEVQRRQTKIVVITLLAACLGYSVVYVPGIYLHAGTDRIAYDLVAVPLFWLLALPLPFAFTIAMLRHQLLGVSAVLVRTIVVGLLAAFITLAYVAIVVGVGSLVGGRSNLALSLLATALVALAFQPVRDRAHRFANQMVFGRRSSPYEVLAEFARSAGETYATEDLLPTTARILAEGTGAESVNVWLRVGDELRVRATWPADAEPHGPPLRSEDRDAPARLDVALFLPVRERSELLGALSVRTSPGDALAPSEEALARQLASEVGLVLRNVRLTEDLLLRMRELQASRQRIVAAQDHERRRLERNLHDGAQQQLVALAVKAGLAKAAVSRDPAAAETLLEQIQTEAREAQQTLRDLARGIYPALLADEGLETALRSQAQKAPVPIEIRADGVGRHGQDTEAAAYFCVLEALQNVTKYAHATLVTVELEERDGFLGFRVTDDGVGFDRATTPMGSGLQNMADRAAALGGELEVRSAPGRGTTVSGRLPATRVV